MDREETFAAGESAATAGAVLPVAAGAPESANASTASLVRNATFGYLAVAVGSLTGFLVTPVLVRALGSDQFGLWVLLGSLASYAGMVELGVSTATAMRIADCHATGDQARLEGVLATATVMFVGVAGCVLLVTAGLTSIVQHLVNLPPGSLAVARRCLLVLGVNQALLFLGVVRGAILFGLGRLDLTTRTGMTLNLCSSAANVLVVWLGWGIVALAGVMLATTALNILAMHAIIRRHFPAIRIRWRNASAAQARDLLRFGAKNFLVTFGWLLSNGSDTLVIGWLLPVANVAHYAVASKLVGFIRTLASKPSEVLMPAYSHSQALRDHERMFRLFARSTAISLLVALPAVTVLCLDGRTIIGLWVGGGHETSYAPLVLLGLSLVLQMPGQAAFSILTGSGRNLVLVKIALTAGAANLLLSIVLTKALGVTGVAAGTLVTVVMADALLLPFLVCRQFAFSYAAYLARGVVPLVFPAVAALGCGGGIRLAFPGLRVAGTLAAVGATGLVFLLAFAATAVGREIYGEALARLRSRV